MRDKDLHWLAGLLEGEGSFMKPPPSQPNQPTVALHMTDEDVVARVANLVGVRHRPVKNRNPGVWKDSFLLQVRGGRAVELMTTLRPLMGARRQVQIDRALANYDPMGRYRHKQLPDAKELKRRNASKSMRALAEEFGCSRQTILRRIHDL
jgi:hypothetical protein